MVENPTVSVIMPTYNEERYVTEAVQSILGQTFENFEFIIIDGGSTDKTISIIKSYMKDDNRIRLVTNETDNGLPASLNRGIAEARGKYIARMDADDKSLPGRFAAQVRFLDANQHTHVVGCYVRYINSNGRTLGTRKCTVDRKNPETRKCEGPDIAHPSVMMRRKSVQTIGNYRESFARSEDKDLWVRMSRKFGPSFSSVIPYPLFEYRVTPDLFERRQIDRIYGSYAGDFVGDEDILRNRIASQLKQVDTDLPPGRQNSMYHFMIGQILHGERKNIKSIIQFAKSFRYDPIYALKNGFYRLWNRQ